MLPTVQRRWSWSNSYFVWLFGFYYEAFHVEAYLVPCSHFLSVLFSIVVNSRRKARSRLYTFVCLSCMRFSSWVAATFVTFHFTFLK